MLMGSFVQIKGVMPGTCHQVGGVRALGSTVMANSRKRGFVGPAAYASFETILRDMQDKSIHKPPITVLK